MKAILLLTALLLAQLTHAAELLKGDVIVVTIRNVEDAQKVNGEYTVDDLGGVRLPYLDSTVHAVGMSPAAFARKAEKAYKVADIYINPAIEVVAKKAIRAEGAVVSVGGKVKRSGPVAFRDGMTVLNAIDAAGGRDDFGGRNVLLIRGGKEYCLDFKQLKHLSIRVRENDSLQVVPKPALVDRWKGNEAAVKPLLGE